MGFLDNSGDIILDAVLTDTGRYRLAKGDGSFKITKFSLGDDEINYGSYNSTHASGSAYYDLAILQTPVLECFTDNAAMMKSKLLTVARNNLLYLPILKLNEVFVAGSGGTERNQDGVFLVTVDEDTEVHRDGRETAIEAAIEYGVIFGFTGGGAYIKVDQGLDSPRLSPNSAIDSDLRESQYMIEIDNRLGNIVSVVANGQGRTLTPAFIDDDQIATYYVSDKDTDFVIDQEPGENPGKWVIRGHRGTSIKFRIKASLELSTSNYLFDKLGGTATYFLVATQAEITDGFNYIDTMVRVTGATTGYRLDVPVRFIKRNSA